MSNSIKKVVKGYRMVFILIALIALFGIITPNFLKVNSLMTILCQVSMIAIAGIGGGLVIIAGGIDISCGSVMSFSTIIAAYMMVDMNINSWAAAIAALLATTIIGYIQGFLITKTKIPPMICGLGIMTAVKGAGYLICGGVSIYLWCSRAIQNAVQGRAVWCYSRSRYHHDSPVYCCCMVYEAHISGAALLCCG